MCNQYMGTGEMKNCEFILVGTKNDVVEKNAREREVDTDLAEQWADSQGMRHFELTSFDKEEVQGAVYELLGVVSWSEKRRQGVGEKEESQSFRSNNSVREQMKRVFGKLKSGA
ncbi:hypothetical protein BDU57DRAFT_513855 [Ampelomyces quisqualis]|uniref:P-loop containing nucleoside triphosphate hydrolase protein n=1 Tax=Ampelomyces quisqualis TaxID=50730 RepID=A0A6A5QUD5_AMPQU|nr:hypothetical protein BDU57DRAFT_513855 [Ampelomyces quisqualis]